MTTPSSQFHSQQLLLLLLLPVILAAAAAETIFPRPDCPNKCGDIDIPFPFGIGHGCFRKGFEILCNHSFVPPRAFFANNDNKTGIRAQRYFIEQKQGFQEWEQLGHFYISPLELASISVATGEARAYAPVSYHCSTNETWAIHVQQCMHLESSPFAVQAMRNALIGMGWDAISTLIYLPKGTNNCLIAAYWQDIACLAYDNDYPPEPLRGLGNGSCMGSCCEATLVRHATTLSWDVDVEIDGDYKHEKPCSYGMLVEKPYNHNKSDIYGKTLLHRLPRGVPFILDFAFAAGNTSDCANAPDYACVSDNSYCANATYSDWPGYVCKCCDGYAGNPYVRDGCQDIDECKLPQVYRCSSGICKNRLGGYDCPCKFGMKGDGKEGTCTDIFTPAAKATVGAIGGILLMVILSLLLILHKEKKNMKEFYETAALH